MDIWDQRAIEPEKSYYMRLGPLGLWFKKVEDEMHISLQRGSEEARSYVQDLAEAAEPSSETLEWTRWIVGSDASTVHLSPGLPDRPVVVRTESPVIIPMRKEARFHVSIPVWLVIHARGAESVRLGEFPTVLRSNIWFGDAQSGELCYSLISRARRQIKDADHPVFKAVCPVVIHNASKEPLKVERFCVHVEHLSIYQKARLLWTNEVTVHFQGADQISRIDYARHKPKHLGDLKRLAEPRVPLKETLLKRSLVSFTRLTNI